MSEAPGSNTDLDPASPGTTDESVAGDGVGAANFGLDGHGDLPEGLEAVVSPLSSVEVDIAKASAFLQQCMTSNPRVLYGLGAKIKPGQVPGRDFKAVDCSGFVREALRRSTDLGSSFPDGSVVQHDWARKQKFKKSTVKEAEDRSGVVRIAFLSPGDVSSGIGHVVLIHMGRTLESHGGVGPDSRVWDGSGWQAKTDIFVLDPLLQA